MMPFIQGDPDSIPDQYWAYREILLTTYVAQGDIGYLTIDELRVLMGKPHRGDRAKYGRALHTEAGLHPQSHIYGWGRPVWGGSHNVTLERDVQIKLANNLDGTCAIWDADHPDTSIDGDIGDVADQYPYDEATFLRAGEVHQIGIFTPHESLPVTEDVNRQFLRIVGSGVHGREPYFTINPLLAA
jgi:hypothetical protein